MRADGSAHRHEGKPVAKVPRTVAVTARGGRHKEQRVPRFARTPTAAQRLGAATPATGSPRAFIFSLENAVCKDSYRPLCGEQPEKPIAPTFSSVRILTEAFSTEKINAGGLRVPAWLSHRCGLAVLAGTSACVGLPLVRQRSSRAPLGPQQAAAAAVSLLQLSGSFLLLNGGRRAAPHVVLRGVAAERSGGRQRVRQSGGQRWSVGAGEDQGERDDCAGGFAAIGGSHVGAMECLLEAGAAVDCSSDDRVAR